MNKSFSLFINFDGNCREAAEYYAKVFKSKVQDLMLYSQQPPDPEEPLSGEDKDRVLFCAVPIFGSKIMFCDVPSSSTLAKGDNLSPVLGTDDKDEIRRVYDEFIKGGEIFMPLEKTFWTELYGVVRDKYGITWQLSYEAVK